MSIMYCTKINRIFVQLRACHVTVRQGSTLTPPRHDTEAVQLKPLAWNPFVPVCAAHYRGVRLWHPNARNLTSTPSQVRILNIVRPIPYAF